MATMTVVVSIPANSRSANLLAGKTFEFAPAPSIVNVYAVAAAVGMNLDVLIGGENVMNDEEVSGANRFPQVNTDLTVRAGASIGDRLFIAGRNTTGAAIVLSLLVEVLAL